jgi:hypothetical protein
LGVDKKASKYPNLSPYVYVANNPLLFIDPNGKELVLPSIFTAFGYNVQKDLNTLYGTRIGRKLIRDLDASKTKIFHSDASRFYLSDKYDVKNSKTTGDYPNYWEAKKGEINVEYAQRENVTVDGITASSFIVLAHEYSHARDIDSGILEELHKGLDKNVKLDMTNEISEVRAMITENLIRKEMGNKEIRTEYSGVKLLKDDGVTPIKNYGVDVTKGLIDEK